MNTLSAGRNRTEALATLKEYNREPFHIRHGLTVGAVMEWMAQQLGYGGERVLVYGGIAPRCGF